MERKKSLIDDHERFKSHFSQIFLDQEEELRPSHFPKVLVHAMRLAGEEREKSGQEKKEAIIKLIKTLFMNFPVLHEIVPDLIDQLIAVEQGHLTLNPEVERACSKYCCWC